MNERTVSVSEFKTHCLGHLQEISKTKHKVIITKRGKPIAEVVPIDNSNEFAFGDMAETVTMIGDIKTSFEDEWDLTNGE